MPTSASIWGGAFGGIGDLFERPQRGALGRTLVKQRFRIPLDDGQDVVEIMSHAGSQLAHRFELLGVPELGFEVENVRHVGAVAMHHMIDEHREKRPGDRSASRNFFWPVAKQSRTMAEV